MRGTGIAGVVVFGIFALIVADIWTHPKGTAAAGSAIIQTEKNFGNQAIGK